MVTGLLFNFINQTKVACGKINLKTGDIVLVQDKNATRGQWKLAEVMEAKAGRDGKVRDVTLRYKSQAPGKQGNVSKYTGAPDTIIKRSVQRLVLILEADHDDASGGGVYGQIR